MKKVRIAAGIAIPVAAVLMAGTGVANAAVTQGTQKAATAAPAITCVPAFDTVSNYSVSGAWGGYVGGTDGCVDFQVAHLTYGRTGVTERVRYVNTAGTFLYTNRLAGDDNDLTTYFSSSHPIAAYAVWQAAVKNGTSSRITTHASVRQLVP